MALEKNLVHILDNEIFIDDQDFFADSVKKGLQKEIALFQFHYFLLALNQTVF